jgi:hypothetical protein
MVASADAGQATCKNIFKKVIGLVTYAVPVQGSAALQAQGSCIIQVLVLVERRAATIASRWV